MTTYNPGIPVIATRKYNGRGDTQPDATLRELWGAGEVPAVVLSKIALQYCRVLNTLKKDGWLISNRVEHVGKAKHGFYKLDGWAPVISTGSTFTAATTTTASSSTTAPATQPALFKNPGWKGDE